MSDIHARPRGKDGKFRKTRAAPVMDDLAIVVLELDRKTGRVRVDAEFATPLEASAMCYRAWEQCEAKLPDDD
jgi:hypothetical protein